MVKGNNSSSKECSSVLILIVNCPWIWSLWPPPKTYREHSSFAFANHVSFMWCSKPWKIWLEHMESLGRWHLKGEQPVPWRVSLIPACWSCILAPLYSTAGWDVCLWPTLPVIRLPVMQDFQNKAASSVETHCKPAHCVAFWNLGTLKDCSSKNIMYTDFLMVNVIYQLPYIKEILLKVEDFT